MTRKENKGCSHTIKSSTVPKTISKKVMLFSSSLYKGGLRGVILETKDKKPDDCITSPSPSLVRRGVKMSNFPSGNSNSLYGVSTNDSKRKAFTLVELLVVIAIITILASGLVVATTSVLNKARATNTRAVLEVVSDAIESFKRDQQENPSMTRVIHGSGSNRVTYKKRYGLYPPDELEVYTPLGIPGSKPPGGSLAGKFNNIVPGPESISWGAMRYYKNGIVEEDALEHRDLLSMITAIELYSESGAAALSKLPSRNRTAGPVDAKGDPSLFLDRAFDTAPNGSWDAEDYQIRYIVDGWGVPIGYLAQRDFKEDNPTKTISSNHPDWNEGSTEIIRLNRGQPVIMSYGPNGKDQLTQEWMETQPGSSTTGNSIMIAKASLVGDFEDDHKVNHPLNEDNIYLDPSLKERLARGIEE